MSIKTRYGDAEHGSQWHCPGPRPPRIGLPMDGCICEQSVHFLLTLSRGEALKDEALNGSQKEPEDLSSGLSP